MSDKYEGDERLKHIMKNYDSMKIGPDDAFSFHCTMCGKCCINREDIILNPYDLYRVAKALNKTPAEVAAEYCDIYLGGSSKMVILRLKPVGAEKRCPLLKGKKCSVHSGKPTVCALYPLGRGFKSEIDDKRPFTEREIQYIYQKPSCGDRSEKHTVREWLEDFDFLTDEMYFKQWMQLVIDCGKAMRKIEELSFFDLLNGIGNAILQSAYLNYTTEEPFMPQFEENTQRLRDLFGDMMPQIYEYEKGKQKEGDDHG